MPPWGRFAFHTAGNDRRSSSRNRHPQALAVRSSAGSVPGASQHQIDFRRNDDVSLTTQCPGCVSLIGRRKKAPTVAERCSSNDGINRVCAKGQSE